MNLKKIIAETYYRPQRIIANFFDEPAVILIYHRVVELQRDPQLLAVKPDNFYRQIEYLKKSYNLLTVEEFNYLIHAKKKFPPNSILLTFDDGYADNLANAVPILESLSAQALFFVTTSNLNTGEEMWWDKLDQIFFSDKDLPNKLSILLNGREFNFDLSNEQMKQKTYNSLHPLIKFNKKDLRDDILKRLFEWAGLIPLERENYRMLQDSEVLRMAESNAAVLGAHTHTHTP